MTRPTLRISPRQIGTGALLALVSVTALAAWGRQSVPPTPPELFPKLKTKTPVEIGKGLKGSSYLEAIDRLAARAGLPDLRKAKLAGDDAEVRVWTYRELAANPLYGRIVRHRGNQSTAYELIQPVNAKAPVVLRKIGFPKGGWIALWRAVRPLATLRDADELPPDDVAVLDGESTIVEIATPGAYRAYLHSNPEFHKARPDAVTLVEATASIDRAFAPRKR